MPRRILRALRLVWLVGTVVSITAPPVLAEAVVAGRSAQALRCAAYIGMAARYGVEEGFLSERDADAMTWWSAQVLDRWVPLPTEARLAAYGVTLRELGSRDRSYHLIARHSEWCIRAFDPAP